MTSLTYAIGGFTIEQSFDDASIQRLVNGEVPHSYRFYPYPANNRLEVTTTCYCDAGDEVDRAIRAALIKAFQERYNTAITVRLTSID